MENHDYDVQSLDKLYMSVSLIAVGLYNAESAIKEAPTSFQINNMFRKGYHMFLELRRTFGNVEDFNYDHITSFFDHFLLNPLHEWFHDWDKKAQEMIQENEPTIYTLDALLRPSPEIGYMCTDSCMEFLNSLNFNGLEEMEQKRVYKELIKLDQRDYVYLRRFLIENQEVDHKDMTSAVMRYSDNTDAITVLKKAYDQCIQDNGKIIHKMVRGVRQFIADPGIYELQLADFCEAKGLRWELWPEKDRYDLKITFDNNEIWAIDVKAYSNANCLRNQIVKDGGFPKGNYTKGYIVVPTEKAMYLGSTKEYTNVVQRYFKIYQPYIQCITTDTLKRRITAKLKQTKGAQK